jgi:hypothetical protein
MEDTEKEHPEITGLENITGRIAHALALRDCAQTGMALPEKDHELWGVWNDSARVVTEELNPELMAFLEYEHTIRWMTTCHGCAGMLESSYHETVRRELNELTLKEISEWAHSTRHSHVAGEVMKILEDGQCRQDNNQKGEKSEIVAGKPD